MLSDLFWDVFDCFSTPDETGSSGGDKTHFLTRRSKSVDCSRFTQVLVVTTTVGMVNGVHSDTGNLRESLSQSLEFVPEDTSLHDRLFISSSTSNDTNSGSAASGDSLSWAWWESDSGSASIFRVPNNSGIGSWASGVRSFVSNRWLNVADDSTFSDSVDWEDIADWDGGFPSAEDVLSRVGPFSSQEILSSMLVSVRISEIDFQQRSSSSWVMDHRPDDSFNISLSFSVVKVTISWRSNSLGFGGSVNASGFTLSLTYDKIGFYI